MCATASPSKNALQVKNVTSFTQNNEARVYANISTKKFFLDLDRCA